MDSVKHFGLLIVLVLWCCYDHVCSFTDMYLSVSDLEKTMTKVDTFVQGINPDTDFDFDDHPRYVRSLVASIDDFKTDMDFYQILDTRWQAGFRHHPVFMYKFVHNLFSIVNQLIQVKYKNKDLLKEMSTSMNEMVKFVEGIARLQEAYDLPVDLLAEGYVAGEESEPLQMAECFRIGKLMTEYLDCHHFAVEWLHQAEEGDFVIDQDTVDALYSTLAEAYLKMDKKRRAYKVVQRWKEVALYKYLSTKSANEMVGKIDTFERERKRRKQADPDQQTVNDMCRYDQPLRTDQICRFYDNGGQPELILKPLRQEVLNVDPSVVVYRDVLTDGQMAAIIRDADEKLQPSSSEINGVFKSTMVKGETALSIQKSLLPLTQYSHFTYEDIEVFNFGFAGNAKPHHDFKGKSGAKRTATMLAYISEVYFGGYTVFPELDIKITPTKGSVVVWQNADENGGSIPAMRHADCPVVLGDKWTLVQRIRESTCPVGLVSEAQ